MATAINEDVVKKVTQVIVDYAEIGSDATSITPNEDLFALGMSSRASVSVMLGLESEFDIEFPDEMLRRDVFESIGAISAAVSQLLG